MCVFTCIHMFRETKTIYNNKSNMHKCVYIYIYIDIIYIYIYTSIHRNIYI